MTYRDASDTSKITMSFQAIGKHGKLIHEAARTQGENASTYMRRIVLLCVAADLGIELDMAGYETTDLVTQAAKKLGMTPREFAANAARDAAADALGLRERMQRSAEQLSRLREPPPGETGERRIAGTRRAR